MTFLFLYEAAEAAERFDAIHLNTVRINLDGENGLLDCLRVFRGDE